MQASSEQHVFNKQSIVSLLKPVAIWRLRRNDPGVSNVSRIAAESFGKNVALHRAKAGVTQEELGHLSSVHRTEIGLLENGHRQSCLDTIVKIAGAWHRRAQVRGA